MGACRLREAARQATQAAIAMGVATSVLPVASPAHAQGLTSSSLTGMVRADRELPVDGALIRVAHAATGFVAEAQTRHGRFHIYGLEPGGPYTATVRALGLAAESRDNIYLALGETLHLEFTLRATASQLDTVRVSGRDFQNRAAGHGPGTVVDENELRLPALDRDLYDFVRLVPELSTKIGLPNSGFSAAGVGFRFNNFLINGVSERTLAGGVSTAFSGARSVPLDAVKEYQVLTAPYDVRYGDFAGGLINTVTKSGSNALRGSAFVFGRNDRLARDDTLTTRYERLQYGFSVGGPLIRDRVHFFVSPEVQHFQSPAPGPYVGQPEHMKQKVPVREEDLERFQEIISKYGLTAGSSGPVQVGNPLRNLLSRIDVSFPGLRSRAVLWNNYGDSREITFSRADTDTFSLSSYRSSRVGISRMTGLQLHTMLSRAGGGHNELLVSRRADSFRAVGEVDQPLVRVAVPGLDGTQVTLNSGTVETAHGGASRSYATSVRNDLTFPLGASHVIFFGVEAERFAIRRRGVQSAYGVWSFASLDDFDEGVAQRYEAGIEAATGSIPIRGGQYSAYLSDQWTGSRLSITAGLRADILAISGAAPYHPGVDSVFGRRTDQMPRRRIELSPRAGFTWNVDGRDKQRLRGGAGIFATRYPLAWAHSALSNYGIGTRLLRCAGTPSAPGLPPAFNQDYRTRPSACADGREAQTTRRGDVNLLDRNLRMARALRGSIAWDVRLPQGVLLSTEALVTRMLSDFLFENLNLSDSTEAGRDGRVMYGEIGPTGLATPRVPRPTFGEVIGLRNTSANRSLQLSARLHRDFTDRAGGTVSYTFSRVRDVQTPLRVNVRGTTTWASARAVSGRHDDESLGISGYDIPHRVVVAGSYAIPLWRTVTEVSLYFVGESGRPFTYVAAGSSGAGDLNADGANNDPLYVPRYALDTAEISFDATVLSEQSQRSALEELIRRTPCLDRQRGRILRRNSCREPWSNLAVASVRQVLPFGGRAVEAQLDIFNVLNLLRSDWGLRQEANPGLLDHVGQTPGTGQASKPVFVFNADKARTTANPAESAFQLQLALRYRF